MKLPLEYATEVNSTEDQIVITQSGTLSDEIYEIRLSYHRARVVADEMIRLADMLDTLESRRISQEMSVKGRKFPDIDKQMA